MDYFILKVGCAVPLSSDAAALLKSSRLPSMPFYCALSSHIIPLSVPTTSHFWRVENTHPHTEPGSRICSWFTQLFGDSDEQRLNHKHESMILHFNLWRGFFYFPVNVQNTNSMKVKRNWWHRKRLRKVIFIWWEPGLWFSTVSAFSLIWCYRFRVPLFVSHGSHQNDPFVCNVISNERVSSRWHALTLVTEITEV